MPSATECMKREWFGDGVTGTSSATAFISLFATTFGKKLFPADDVRHLVQHFTSKSGLVASTASLFNKIGDGTATSADWGNFFNSIIDTALTVVQLAYNKSPWGLTFTAINTAVSLLAPIVPCLLEEDPTETPDIKPAEKVKSPLAIDLDGDGIATYALKNGVYFDIDADGFAEKTAWLNAKDAFLAIDRNKNGIIDDASELFGDSDKAVNGFEALKALDTNGDGVIDANDAGWEDLMLWQDAINDGVSQEKELISVAEAGIERIELNYINQDVVDENGNQHLQTATVYWKDGHTTVIEDIWFQHNNAQTIDLTPLDVTDEEWAELAELPYIDAFGNVHSLWVAMSLDACNDEFFTKQSNYLQAA